MQYILKNKDEDIVKFEVMKKEVISKSFGDKSMSQKIESIEIINKALLPIDLEKCTQNTLRDWILKRKIPSNRRFVEKVVATYSDKDEYLMDYIDVSFGLSLNDSFWITPNDKKYKWSDYNLYNNEFSKALELASFGLELQKISGFTSSPEYTTNGALKKCWHRDCGQVYLYKGSSELYANGGKEAFSEYYMAQIAEVMGFNHVFYDLKEFHNEIVSVCPIFTSENEGFMPIYKCLNGEWKSLEKDELIDAIAEIYDIEQLRDLMLFDAIIYNSDRHLGNFGMIIDNNTQKILRPAPIFDNGFSMINFLTLKELDDIKFSLQNKMSQFGYDFDTQMRKAVSERHLLALEKLAEFTFKKHAKFNLDDEWLEPINEFIKQRAREAIEIFEKNIYYGSLYN